MHKIIHGDCLDELRKFAPESFDAVITDPPYGIDYQSAWRTDRAQWKPKIANDKQPFIWWLYDAYRVLKNDAPILCFCRWDVQEAFRQSLEWAGFTVKSQVIWDRQHHGMGDLNGAFAPQHDVIWFAVKGRFKFPGGRPKSIIRSTRISGTELTHPNEKPIELMQLLVNSVTAPGQIILDPFAGSGATVVAAKSVGRQAVGIERDAGYVEHATARISDPQTDLLAA